MSLLDDTFGTVEASLNNYCRFNTGSLFDLATGYFEKGFDGKWYLNGGLGCQINGFVGRNGTFKSSLSLGLGARTRAIYKTVQVINDQENSADQAKDRVEAMCEELEDRLEDAKPIWIPGGNQYYLEKFDAYVIDHCNRKREKQKDLMIETPFVDPKTGKRIQVILPTIMCIDSLTEMACLEELNKVTAGKKEGAAPLEDAAIKTIYMISGNKKTMWTQIMRRRAEEYGLILIMTGHYDEKMQIDPYHPNVKETMFGKQNWVVKGVGTKFKFLSSLYARTEAVPLQDSNGEALYADGLTYSKDIFEVDVNIDRCKTAVAGTTTPFICGQKDGLLNALPNYHYIRQDNFWGCTSNNKIKQQLSLVPNVTLSRNTVRSIASSTPEVRRALEITASLCYIKNNWNPENIQYDLKEDPKKIFDFLMSDKNKTLRDDILASRGWWSPYEEEQPYMSVIDIVDLINKG